MKKFLFLSIFILINLVFRIFLSINNIPKGDILVHQEWAKILFQQGLPGSYFFEGWTYTPPTQPPLMMSGFYLSEYIYQNRNIFSQLHNTIKIPPAFILLGFQKYGQILTLRLWETFFTYIIASIFFFYFSKKISFTKSLLIFNIIIFNPISLFINSIWGQNDILPTTFMYLSFLGIFSNFVLLSPILFLIGILFKPTIAILSPIFLCLFIKIYQQQNHSHKLIKLFLIFFSCLIVLWFSFKPFIPSSVEPISYTTSIIKHRIATSSKGLNLASISAFNLYSLIFKIDQTYATNQNSFFQLKDFGLAVFILINAILIVKLFKTPKVSFNHTLFYIFIISQSAFLFLTNMLDRYFIPGFLSSIIIMVLYWKKFGVLMFLQQIIWFCNLTYAYYYRDNQIIFSIFRNNNFLLIRVLSSLNLFIFFFIFKQSLYSKTFSPNIKINKNIYKR